MAVSKRKMCYFGGFVGSFQFSVIKCSVKHRDCGGWRKLVRLEVNSGAHGVTRPTTRGLARRWMIVSGFTAGRKSCAGLERCRAIKCLLRRLTES